MLYGATEEQIRYNTMELEACARSKLFSESSDIEGIVTLQNYASRVDDIRGDLEIHQHILIK